MTTLKKIGKYRDYKRLGLQEYEWWAEEFFDDGTASGDDFLIIACREWRYAAEEAAEYIDPKNEYDSDIIFIRLTGWYGQHHIVQLDARTERCWDARDITDA